MPKIAPLVDITAKIFGKIDENRNMPVWYQKQWKKIERYVSEETNSFIKTLDYLMLKLPQLKTEVLALHKD